MDIKISHIIKKQAKYSKHYGHEFVDLGLPSGILWATENLGACKEWPNGLYYQFGSNIGFGQYGPFSFDKDNYPFKQSNGEEDIKFTIPWGGGWRMPSMADFDELKAFSKCIYYVDNYIEVQGFNGNYVRFYNGGYRHANMLQASDYACLFWTDTVKDDIDDRKRYGYMCASIPSETFEVWTIDEPWLGMQIRPVIK